MINRRLSLPQLDLAGSDFGGAERPLHALVAAIDVIVEDDLAVGIRPGGEISEVNRDLTGQLHGFAHARIDLGGDLIGAPAEQHFAENPRIFDPDTTMAIGPDRL